MSNVCEICGKRPMSGNNVSHAHNLNRRRWKPNVRRILIEWQGGRRRVNVCMRCLKSGKVKKVIA